MKSARLHLIINAILLIVLLLMLVSTSIAYFSEHREVRNVMTSGNVKIELSEAAVKKDGTGNLIEDTSKPRIFGDTAPTINDYGKIGRIFPSQSIYKDPTIHNIGTDDAWIAFKVVINDGDGDIHKLLGYEGYDEIDIEEFFTGELSSKDTHLLNEWNGFTDVLYNDDFYMVQVPKRSDDEYHFNFFIRKKLPKDESVTLFNQMHIPSYWTNENMKELVDLEITVHAFAVQTVNLNDCFTAMRSAFPDHF